ncbi:nucleoside-diphosphate kinase [Micromonospora cathayae]|uniref:Nucleoside-diphosphate kinase n=1 Tax=Micromonospora cathayae TaxID=3028804 RepID=A0ABY7ZUL5_9ACTN|nr:nucleoside-diphosphate kinase [Micromonospora sp. HUAS 3]WDZ85842.1 nucleoside-diphosphate kinase [Micromonospora sp. HUAS 3]
MPLKAQFYERETYFRESFADVVDILGPEWPAKLRDGALLMMKPEGLIAAKLETVHSFLVDHQFSVVAVEDLALTGHRWRELWRYQLTSATLDRLTVNELAYGSGRALTLVLKSDPDHDLPATVRLSTLKGSASLAAQVPGTLRSLLQQPNRVFSLVHFADEPADLVRELGVLFDAPARRRLLTALGSGVISAEDRVRLDRAIAQPADATRSLDLAPAVRRIDRALADHAAGRPGERDRVAALRDELRRAADGDPVEFRAFVRELSRTGCPVDTWDLTVLGSYAVTCDEPGHPKSLTNPDPQTWRTPAEQHADQRLSSTRA